MKPSNPQASGGATTFSLTLSCDIPEKLLAEALLEKGRLVLVFNQEGDRIILIEEETNRIICESRIESGSARL